jgi:XTP/dITP diphosphohydrolase
MGAMTTFLIATGNAHKVVEIRAMLGDGFRYLTLKDFPGAPQVVEDAPTFAGNAAKKAVALADWLAENPCGPSDPREVTLVLADDSGLEVDILNGAPGVHSARFAALDDGRPGNSTTAENNAKLLRLLQEVPPEKRTARFRCVLAVASPRPGADYPAAGRRPVDLFDGDCQGHILSEHRGSGGFGYDPLFVPDGYERTFAELGEEVKNALSHRAKALAKLRVWLNLA